MISAKYIAFLIETIILILILIIDCLRKNHKKDVISFAEWIGDEGYDMYFGAKWVKRDEDMYTSSGDYISTEELYKLYLNSK